MEHLIKYGPDPDPPPDDEDEGDDGGSEGLRPEFIEG